MAQAVIRLAAFLVGLVGFWGMERLAPDHPPTVPLPRRWVTNLGFGLFNGLIVSLACTACFAFTAMGFLPGSFAPLRFLNLSPWARIPIEVLLLDFFTYLLHRSYHAAPLLWRFHLVHHSDLDLDVSSASRFHVGEVLISMAAKVGIVALIGISPQGLVVFEAVLLACAQFQHANVHVPLRLESALWRTVVPPAMHRIHHTPDPTDTNSNFGTILTLWDEVLGTYRRHAPVPFQTFGVEALRDPSALGLTRLFALPFRRTETPSTANGLPPARA